MGDVRDGLPCEAHGAEISGRSAGIREAPLCASRMDGAADISDALDWLLPDRRPSVVSTSLPIQTIGVRQNCESNARHASSLTTTPAWIVYAWPPVLWQAAEPPEFHLVHLGTRVLDAGSGNGNFHAGQTIWGEASALRTAGVAWDWVEIGRGVIAIADPLGVVTNLQLIDGSGAALKPGEIAIRLHQLVHSLPWQAEVRRAMENSTDQDASLA